MAINFQTMRRTIVFIAMTMVCFINVAWTAGADPGAAIMLPRWPLILLGISVAVIGLWGVKPTRLWLDLSLKGKLLRLVGVSLASVGLVVASLALTIAPPLYPGGTELTWWEVYEDAQRYAEQSDKPVMVDFTADWCTACKELEAEVFNHPDVRERLESEFVSVKIDFDHPSVENTAILRRLQVTGLPTVVFLSPQGDILKQPSFEGKVDRDDFMSRLDAALDGGEMGEHANNPFGDELNDKNLVGLLLLVFIAGLLSSFTPCVYPLIPITISVFGASQASTKWQGFKLSFTYVTGIALTYAALGIAAASLGTVFGSAMQNPILVGMIALLFFVLGLSSLGIMEFRLPGVLQTKLSQQGGMGYWGAFAMGLVAGIIAAPCIGPIVAGILLYVAQQQDIVLGSLLLVTFAFGMGTLFLFLGTFSSLLNRLPRAGNWLQSTKIIFGVIFVALAFYYLRLIIPGTNAVLESLWRLVTP